MEIGWAARPVQDQSKGCADLEELEEVARIEFVDETFITIASNTASCHRPAIVSGAEANMAPVMYREMMMMMMMIFRPKTLSIGAYLVIHTNFLPL